MKKLTQIAIGIVVVLVLLSVALALALGPIVTKSVNAAGPAALGVPVTLRNAAVSLLRGEIVLVGLHVGNPPGYKTDGLLDLGSVSVKLDLASLFSDAVAIQLIAIDGLVVTYEKGLLNSNLGALIDLLSAAEEKPEASGKTDEEEPGKKVIIEKLVIADSQMKLSITGAAALTGGGALPIPLPKITLTDLGKEKDGVTLVEAFRHVLTAIAKATGTALAGAGNLLGDAGKAAGAETIAAGKAAVGGTVDAGKAVVDGAAGALKAIYPFEKMK